MYKQNKSVLNSTHSLLPAPWILQQIETNDCFLYLQDKWSKKGNTDEATVYGNCLRFGRKGGMNIFRKNMSELVI